MNSFAVHSGFLQGIKRFVPPVGRLTLFYLNKMQAFYSVFLQGIKRFVPPVGRLTLLY